MGSAWVLLSSDQGLLVAVGEARKILSDSLFERLQLFSLFGTTLLKSFVYAQQNSHRSAGKMELSGLRIGNVVWTVTSLPRAIRRLRSCRSYCISRAE
mmetsp:Transcript_34390/g.79381  ORF Transcript_34390/g.79381 Transcript_34390/m.79381 type:complete len:98 (+) Transcript_34390:393-686(+)